MSSQSNPPNIPNTKSLRGILEENSTHYQRVCLYCGYSWLGLHCPHDGYQNPCPACDKRPTQVIPKPIKSDSCNCASVTDIDEAAQDLEALFNQRLLEAEITNLTALKNYMVGGSATFVDWINYLNDRIAELNQQLEDMKG